MKMYTIGAMHNIGRISQYAKSYKEDRDYLYAKKYPFCKSTRRNSGRENKELGQTVAYGIGGSRGTVLTGRLVEDVGQVMGNRLFADL